MSQISQMSKEVCIVEFLRSNEVDIVPFSWIQIRRNHDTDRDDVFSFWPPFKNTSSVVKAVVKQTPPSSTWDQFPVKIIWRFQSYSEARLHLDKSQYTSNLSSGLDSDEDKENRRPIRKKIRNQFLSSSDEEKEENNIPSPPKVNQPHPKSGTKPPSAETTDFISGSATSTRSPLTTIANNSPVFQPTISCSSFLQKEKTNNHLLLEKQARIIPENNIQSSSTVSQRKPQSVMAQQSSSSETSHISTSTSLARLSLLQPTTPPSGSLENKKSNNNNVPLKLVRKIENVNYKLDSMVIPYLEEIVTFMRSSNNGSVSVEREDAPTIPITSDHELDDFEQYIAEVDNQTYFVDRLRLVGGDNSWRLTHRILKRLLTDEYAQIFNWAGREPKKPFRNLRMKTLVINAVRARFRDASDLEISSAIKSWLKFAKTRRQRQSRTGLE